MSGLKRTTLIALFSLLPALAAAESRIAVLDAQQAILGTDRAQARIKELQAQDDYTTARERLETERAAFEAAVEDFRKNEPIMASKDKEATRQDLLQRRARVEALANDIKSGEQRFIQQLLQEQEAQLRKAVSEVIKADGIGLVLNRQAVIHAEESYNITQKVRDLLNKAE